jgi:hypothetical protein
MDAAVLSVFIIVSLYYYDFFYSLLQFAPCTSMVSINKCYYYYYCYYYYFTACFGSIGQSVVGSEYAV